MTYLLDTCTISNLRKRGSDQAKRLKEWASRFDHRLFFMSVLTIGELKFGILKLSDKEEKIRTLLQNWLLAEVIPSFGNRILSIDQQTCLIWAELSAKAKKKGLNLPISDGLIAATAIKQGLIVITQNTKHFKPFEVPCFNPAE